jgi:hypothetical protein
VPGSPKLKLTLTGGLQIDDVPIKNKADAIIAISQKVIRTILPGDR